MKKRTKIKVETKADLELIECCECGNGEHGAEIDFGPACHRGAPLWVSYKKGHGEMWLRCVECDKIVSKIAVADPMVRN